MQQWRHYVTAAAGLGALVAVLTLTSAGTAISAPVKEMMAFITNDETTPVPVRSVAHDGNKDIFAYEAKLGWGSAAYDCSSEIVVPAGKRLVVEHVSVQTSLVGDDRLVSVHLRPTGLGDNRILVAVPPVYGGQAIANVFAASQPMRVYLDSNFAMCGLKSQATAPAFFSGMIWGYLVDAQ